MLLSRRLVLLSSPALLIASQAIAQTPTVVRLRGTIDSVDGNTLKMTTRSGEVLSMKIADTVGVTYIVPIAVEAIKPGSYIGTAAVSQPDGTLKALEIQVFPESMRGIGEGHRPWDFGAESSMTNGTVGDLKVANGRTLHLTYKDGEKVVFVPPNAPVITYEPATRAAITPKAHVLIFANRAADDSLTAMRVSVGKDGLVPPM